MDVMALVTDPDLDRIAEKAGEIEALGYDYLTVGETQHDPYLPLALVADRTERLRFGTAIAVAFPRVPYATANVAWDLAKFSRGRFVLGLGTQVKGHNERRFSVPWSAPGPRLRDYIGCMRAIWDSWQNRTKPSYEGEFYRYTMTNPYFDPGPIDHPHIPVFISAVGRYNARLAGEVADGVVAHPLATARYVQELLIPEMREGARRANRDPRELAISGGGFVATGRTDAEVADAYEEVRRLVAFYGSTPSYREIFRIHDWEDRAEQLSELSRAGKWDEMAPVVTEEMMDAFCVTGTWEELPGKMRERHSGVTTQIDFPVQPHDPDEAGQLREIIASLQTIPAAFENATP